MPPTLLVKNGTVITGEAELRTIRNAAIVVEGDRIVEVGEAERIRSVRGFDKVVDASGKFVCPGFVNAHTHMLQCMVRGWGDDLDLHRWIGKVLYPIADHITLEDVRAAATLACVEMIKTGVTAVIEHQTIGTSEEMVDTTASVLKAAGLRGIVARGVRQRTKANTAWRAPESLFQYSLDEEAKLTERLIRKWNFGADRKIRVCPGPVSMASVGDELLTACRDLSTKYQVPVHIHVAESKRMASISLEEHGCTEVQRLKNVDALNRFTQVVHGVWLTSEDIALMANGEANFIHCPVSNMYLASGIAPVASCHQSKVNVSLGTDGPASNNSHDMFEVLKTTVLLQKVSTLRPLALTSYQVFEMATSNGASALNRDREFGAISPGKKADMIVIDLERPFTAPVHDPVSTIVYCARPDNVDTVIVDGQVIMESGRVLTIDEEEAVRVAKEASGRLAARDGRT